jgi:hypothetical protein
MGMKQGHHGFPSMEMVAINGTNFTMQLKNTTGGAVALQS